MSTEDRILVVDDDEAVAKVLSALLRQAGFEASSVDTGEAALQEVERGEFSLVLSDLKMAPMDGMELLRRIASSHPGLPVILLTAHGTIPVAVEAMRLGAADFLVKPFDKDEVLFIIRKALAASEHRSVPAAASDKELLGRSQTMRDVKTLIARAASSTATVLVRGETGSGKELVARAIHRGSPRHGGPFIAVHCAGLPETLLESELFGYERGAFTGAANSRPGRVELADKGTLFFDEIGDVPLSMQVKLLRVLQDRSFERLGARQTTRVDVRFVAATHRNLEEMVKRGQFREDLFYRLNVVPIWIPPLRERKGDIEELARHFCATHARANGRQLEGLNDAAIDLLIRQSWPGNVRQLENFIERLVVLSEGARIGAAEVMTELARRPGVSSPAAADCELEADLTLADQRSQREREALSTALARARNNRTMAARLLGISRRTLYSKLEEHGML